jgi:hypothetical protein
LCVVARQNESCAQSIQKFLILTIPTAEEKVFNLLDGNLLVMTEHLEEIFFVAVSKTNCLPQSFPIQQMLYLFLDSLIKFLLDGEGHFFCFLRLVFLSFDKLGEFRKGNFTVG